MEVVEPPGWTSELEERYQADIAKWKADPTIDQGYVAALEDPQYGRAMYLKFVVNGC